MLGQRYALWPSTSYAGLTVPSGPGVQLSLAHAFNLFTLPLCLFACLAIVAGSIVRATGGLGAGILFNLGIVLPLVSGQFLSSYRAVWLDVCPPCCTPDALAPQMPRDTACMPLDLEHSRASVQEVCDNQQSKDGAGCDVKVCNRKHDIHEVT